MKQTTYRNPCRCVMMNTGRIPRYAPLEDTIEYVSKTVIFELNLEKKENELTEEK